MSFKAANQFRIRSGPLGSDDSFGCNGAFLIDGPCGRGLKIMASDGMGWEHVSVSLALKRTKYTPNWDEMCFVKEMFWDNEDCVIQYHPPKSKYVNIAEVLHLWRPVDLQIPMPDSIMVGPQVLKEVR
jgi:hypothetical protein